MIQMVRRVVRRWTRDGVRRSLVLVWGMPWAAPLPLSTGDQVTVPALVGSADAVLVARGGTVGAACVYNRLRKGRGALDVGQLVPKSGCASDLLLFSQYGAMSGTRFGWTTGTDMATLPAVRPRIPVEFSYVLVAKGNTAAQQAGWDTVQAIALYNANRTGLTFHARRIILPRDLNTAEVATIGDDCSTVKLNNLAKFPKLYDPMRLNVYFVPGLVGWRGRTCFTVGYPNVIYISIAGESPPTLAHELGHALGLQDWLNHKLGHTGALAQVRIPGFVYQNLMWTGLYDQQALQQWHFSIGQGYRMNMDTKSWVIKANIEPGRVGLICHPNVAADSIPCPSLALDTVPTP
jgi:hypothetical protein